MFYLKLGMLAPICSWPVESSRDCIIIEASCILYISVQFSFWACVAEPVKNYVCSSAQCVMDNMKFGFQNTVPYSVKNTVQYSVLYSVQYNILFGVQYSLPLDVH